MNKPVVIFKMVDPKTREKMKGEWKNLKAARNWCTSRLYGIYGYEIHVDDRVILVTHDP